MSSLIYSQPITAWGVTRNIKQWTRDPRCRAMGRTIRGRIRSGMTPEEAIQTPESMGAPKDRAAAVQVFYQELAARAEGTTLAAKERAATQKARRQERQDSKVQGRERMLQASLGTAIKEAQDAVKAPKILTADQKWQARARAGRIRARTKQIAQFSFEARVFIILFDSLGDEDQEEMAMVLRGLTRFPPPVYPDPNLADQRFAQGRLGPRSAALNFGSAALLFETLSQNDRDGLTALARALKQTRDFGAQEPPTTEVPDALWRFDFQFRI